MCLPGRHRGQELYPFCCLVKKMHFLFTILHQFLGFSSVQVFGFATTSNFFPTKMDPGNPIKYRFVPGRRRAPRREGQRQLTGREITAIMIRRQYHQRGNRQPRLHDQGRRRHADQELPRGGVQVARPRRPAGRGQPPVAVQAPERPPRPCRPDPPQLENPAVEVPFRRQQPGDEHLVPDNFAYNGWLGQPDAFEQQPQNGWPAELEYPEQQEPLAFEGVP